VVGSGMLSWDLSLAQAVGCWAVQVTYTTPEISETIITSPTSKPETRFNDHNHDHDHDHDDDHHHHHHHRRPYVSLASQRGLRNATVAMVRFVVTGCGGGIVGGGVGIAGRSSSCDWRVLGPHESCPVPDSTERTWSQLRRTNDKQRKRDERAQTDDHGTDLTVAWLYVGQLFLLLLVVVIGIVVLLLLLLRRRKRSTDSGAAAPATCQGNERTGSRGGSKDR
jgi:hypothetical protein